MVTMLEVDDHLLAEAAKVTGVGEKSQLVRDALHALIARENARAIIAFSGSDPDAWIPERRRPPAP